MLGRPQADVQEGNRWAEFCCDSQRCRRVTRNLRLVALGAKRRCEHFGPIDAVINHEDSQGGVASCDH
jgi:hypothetical protein